MEFNPKHINTNKIDICIRNNNSNNKNKKEYILKLRKEMVVKCNTTTKGELQAICDGIQILNHNKEINKLIKKYQYQNNNSKYKAYILSDTKFAVQYIKKNKTPINKSEKKVLHRIFQINNIPLH